MGELDITGASLEVRYIHVDDGVALRVLVWTPDEPEVDWPAVLVAGWGSFALGWMPLLEGFARRQKLYFVETREKRTACITRDVSWRDFGVDVCARDLVRACAALDEPVEEQVVFASSLGATVTLEAMMDHTLPVRGAFLLAPNVRFRYPSWAGLILHLPDSTARPALRIVRSYIKHFRVDYKREPEQWERYDRSLREADALRLRDSALAFNGYELSGVDALERPVAIAHAASDTLHASEDWRGVLDAIPGAVDIEAPSDLYLHTADCIPDVDGFVAGLSD